MIVVTVVTVVAALAMLALITQAGVLALQRTHPAQGWMIQVSGATLNVVEIGPRDAAGPPVVMIHGASSNLESMRQPLGEMLASNHRGILVDRPGHGGPDDRAGAGKTKDWPGDLRGSFMGRRAWGAPGAGLSGARRGPGDACAGRLSVARRRRMVQPGRHHAGDRTAAGLYRYAAARLFP